jgi:hypothetical protein
VRELHAERDPLYRETAHDVVDTGRPSIAMLVNIIVMQLELAGIVEPCAPRKRPPPERAGGRPWPQRLNSLPCPCPVLSASPERVDIQLGERSYPILIGAGLLENPANFAAVPPAAALIVSNTTVAPLYASAAGRLAGAFPQVHEVVLPDGEEHKDWQTLNLIFDALLATAATARRCCSPWAAAWSAT